MRIHPSKPFAGNILFDDLWGLSDEERNRIAFRGVVFLTEFKAKGRTYGGTIVSPTEARAELVAFCRGLGEVIIGKLEGTGKWEF